MEKSRNLFNEVFEEIDISQVENCSGSGLTEGDIETIAPRGVDVCEWLLYCCIHDIVIGTCGGGASTDACVAYSQICG